ncbi:hypothetical protein ACIA8O_01925 [Kitasatospora sp. NPDC051853]|uniref:hypothetical protein n=1 Tax=Kitasatospora sp. NPDC051853 TaxID=3364058 RepID=UPI0037A9BE29
MRISAEPGGVVYAVTRGDVHVRDGVPVYRVAPVQPPAPRVTAAEARWRPSLLLLADRRTVAFGGREEELGRLEAWRDDETPGTSLVLLHGPGGQGKTRLAGEFADASRAAGWTCWESRHLSDPGLPEVVAPGEPGRRLLLLVDYAERWPLDDLLLLLGNPLLGRAERTRVLLVSRPADTWWPLLSSRAAAKGIRTAEPLGLGPIAGTEEGRRAVFETARRAFADALGVGGVRPAGPAAPALGDDGLVLDLHMAALVSVHAEDSAGRAGSDPAPASLSSYLIGREHDFWASMYEHGTVATDPTTMARAVHTATLVRAVPEPTARQALARAGVLTDGTGLSLPEVVEDHTLLYPESSADRGLVLAPLYPDRLGEDLIALRTPGHDDADHPWDPWARLLTARLLAPERDGDTDGDADDQQDGRPDDRTDGDADGGPSYVRAALSTLIETARRWPHVAASELTAVLERRPGLTLALTGNSLAVLAGIEAVGVEVLAAVEAALPERRRLDLDTGIAVLAARLTEHRLARTADPLERARLLHDLAVRMTQAGRHAEALAAEEQAQQELFPLAAAAESATPEVLAQFALVMSSLGMQLDRAGRAEDGLVFAELAALYWENLPAGQADAHQAERARAQHNFSLLLTRQGMLPEALAAADLAVAARRAAGEDGTGLLAGALAQRCAVLATMGRHREALTDAEAVVREYRALAAGRPETHAHHLAAAIGNLGGLHLRLGRNREAALAAEETVELFRSLAEVNPAAHEPDLAKALGSLGIRLARAGDLHGGLAAARAAADLLTRLAEASPAAHESALADGLSNLCARLSALRRWEEAIEAGQGAVGIHRRLAGSNPSAHGSDLSAVLSNLGHVLAMAGRDEEGLAAMREALVIDRQLAEADPQRHRADLASTLGRLSALLRRAGLHAERLETAEEMVRIRRTMAAIDAEADGGILALGLTTLSETLRDGGEHDRAVAVAAEAVELCRERAGRDEALHGPLLASVLVGYADALSEAGRHAEALAATEEALRLQYRLADGPVALDGHRADLAEGLVRVVLAFARVRAKAELERERSAEEVRRVLALLSGGAAGTGGAPDELVRLEALLAAPAEG